MTVVFAVEEVEGRIAERTTRLVYANVVMVAGDSDGGGGRVGDDEP